MLTINDVSSSWLDAYWLDRHFDVTRAKHPRTHWHQAARWSAMMKPTETRFRCAVSICHFLSFFFSFFLFFLCASPKRGWGVGIKTELMTVFWLASRLRGSQVKGGNKEDSGAACKIDGSQRELRLCPDEQNKVCRRLEVAFKNSKNSFTLEEPFFASM